MGATNHTTNYNLSQFVGTDKPAWLQDYNGDMSKIDVGINAAKVAADSAGIAAGNAQNDADTANTAITNTINPAITSLQTTVGNQGGAINTINSLIGNGTPTTTDQTIIGAINELHGDIQGLALKGSVELKIVADGVKTRREIFKEMYDLYTNFVASLDSTEKYYIEEFGINNAGAFMPNEAKIRSNSDVLSHLYFGRNSYDASSFGYRCVRLSPTESDCFHATFELYPTPSNSDISTGVSVSGTTFSLFILKYETIA